MTELVFNNIFDAVTNDKEEASALQTRSNLMLIIRDIIDEKKWTQSVAADHLSLSQPRVSDLKSGKIEKFSIDLLINCLFKLGFSFVPKYDNKTLTMSVKKESTTYDKV